MRTSLRLAAAWIREHPMRLTLTSLATAAAAAMVVWVVSGYDAMLGTFDKYSDLALGRYPLSVAPIQHFSQQAPGAIPSHAEKHVPVELLAELKADPAVAAADAMWALREKVVPVVPEGGEVIPWKRMPDARLLATDAPAPPFDLAEGRWIDPARPDLPEAAMSVEAARGMNLGIGGQVVIGSGEKARTLTVVGLVATPGVEGWSATVAGSQLLTPSVGGVFVPTGLAEKIAGRKAEISFIGVSMREGADFTRFRYAWSPRLAALPTPGQFQEAHDIEEALDESASADNVRMQAHMATVVSMLAALFIIFSTLNMGVGERVRQLAILRAVALTRAEVGVIVVFEGLLLGTIGFVVGCGVGKVLMDLAVRNAPELLEDGAVVGRNSLLLAGVCSYGGALLASLWPAIRAMRVRPVDAMAPPPAVARHGVSWKPVIAGLLLVGVYPFLAFGLDHHDDRPFVTFMFIGLATLAAGCLLLAPTIVRAVDRLGGPMVARLLGVPRELLASRISGHLGRTVSTAFAMTVGLGLYTGIQVWGHTMLSGFLPGPWAPDALIGFRPEGIPFADAEKVAGFPGVLKSLPVIVEQPRLKEDLTHSADRATVVRQDNVVLVGIDPAKAFGGGDPLIPFEWVAGDKEEAIRLMATSRACIVPDHFLREADLKVGDSFELVPPENPETPVRYTIAGAVRMPGWHWQTKPTGMRTRTHRSAALVFADLPRVAEDFRFRSASHVWIDYDESSTNAGVLVERARGLYASSLGREVVTGEAKNAEPHVLIHTIADIRALVHGHGTAWLWGLSRLPLVVLAITAVGVLNALLASVRSSRWETGILRSIGITRGTIVRLVIAEGILIGLVACVVSLSFGILAGWCGAGISRHVSFFGGMTQELVIPWLPVLAGLGAVLLLSSLAAAWPAFSLGKTRPLDLLRQGRGSF
ncbi:ABC transporter permease [Luteolibacter yonseiensis]|uniref:ABC transporter permease n=1 Tax=Luteolibacter yonseiensis TaxID=1144680 RepID=A0A934R1J9_9BACT|nr:ABC transporter permease [Luteolibacter yonseiensis]MBK1815246.1 ABC transporter permease [Luteolibacter yonseiensis]